MIEELHEEMATTQEYPAKKSFPHKYEDILKDFGTSIDKSSLEKFLSELGEAGIFDQQKKLRYSVDKKGKNCFTLHARFLKITWGADSRYWTWYPDKRTSNASCDANRDASRDVAELLDVCWLEVQGDFEAGYLTPGTKYQVSFEIKMKDPNYGWEDPVEFSLTPPQEPKQTHKVDLRNLPIGKWTKIPAGEFTPSCGKSGLMNFTLLQTVGKWKKGLVIKGVDISPKK